MVRVTLREGDPTVEPTLTHSRSKRMEDDFDVQRDHVRLLEQAESLLREGTILFSNNHTRFSIDGRLVSHVHD